MDGAARATEDAIPVGEARERRVATLVAIVAAALSVTLIAVTTLAGVTMNRSVLALEQGLVDRQIERTKLNLLNEQKSVALWDDAVRRLDARDSAWLDDEIGTYLTEDYAHDAVVIVDWEGHVLYTHAAAESPRRIEPAALLEAAAPLVGNVRLRAERATVRPPAAFASLDRGTRTSGAVVFKSAAALISDGGAPIVAGTMTIVPTVDPELMGRRPYFLVSGIRLTPARFATLGKDVPIQGLKLTRRDGLKPLATHNGVPLGELDWEPRYPGDAFLTVILPLLALAALSAIYAVWTLLRRLTKSARLLRRSETEALRLAFEDPVSGLPNRRAFVAGLDAMIADAGDGSRIGVAYLDLDRFKDVNDTLGHDMGDRLIAAVAARLGNVLPERSLLARLGGDEYAAAFPISDADAAEAHGDTILAAFDTPFAVGERTVAIDASVGVTSGTAGAATTTDLLREADIALYAAKDAGRGRVVPFRAMMARRLEQRHELERALVDAIGGDELRLVYQPVASLGDGNAVTGVEALLRWNSPVHGDVPPEQFIPVAEASGQMTRLGRWVLARALAEMAHWPNLDVSINLSPAQLHETDIVSWLALCAESFGVKPHRVILEVTEGMVIQEVEHASTVLSELRTRGFRIALDDFGTGYSSLAYLRHYPLDRLKLDRSLIDGVGEDATASSVLETAVALGRRLGLEVVAEGIETAQQSALMRVAGCTHLQGFYISPPVEAEQLGAIAGASTRAA